MTMSDVQKQQAAQRYYDRLAADLLYAFREWAHLRGSKAGHLAVFPWQDDGAMYDLEVAVKGVVEVAREWMEAPQPDPSPQRDAPERHHLPAVQRDAAMQLMRGYVGAVGEDHDR